MDADLLTAVRADLDEWEGYFAWMYLDSNGLVTVGYGTMLPDARSAAQIAFYHKAGPPATGAEITAAWDLVHSGAAKQKSALPRHKFSANHYSDTDDLIITQATASLLRDDHIGRDYIELLAIYPGFDSFPQAAKVALFDMIYNLGPGHPKTRKHRANGLRAFSSLNTAINAGKWADAAKLCHRSGISDERNKATAARFAASAPPPPPPVPGQPPKPGQPPVGFVRP